MNKNILLYGFGERCRTLLRILKDSDLEVVGIVDSDPKKQGIEYDKYEILAPESLRGIRDVTVCVTFFSPLEKEPIWEKLHDKCGVDAADICSFHELLIRACCGKYARTVNDPDIVDKSWNKCFDVSWDMGLGGVEIWLKDIKKAFDRRGNGDILWLTYGEQMKELKDEAPFSAKYINTGIDLIQSCIPCTIVFSRVNELMLSAFLLKHVMPDKIRIVMAVHGSCDGMYRDILSYREGIYHYVCVSSMMKKELENKGIEAENISIMTIPVVHDEILDRHYPYEMGKPLRLGYAGRIEVFQKRVDRLKELISELNRRSIDYILSVAGEGSYEDEFRKYVDGNRLSDKVRFLGMIDRKDIPAFWKGQDIALNVSDYEGRPLSNMEAMLAGCVPVAAYTSGIIEDVRDGENGYVVQKGDINAMADRIEYLNNNRSLLKAMGNKARDDMLIKTDIDRHIDFWMELFDRV